METFQKLMCSINLLRTGFNCFSRTSTISLYFNNSFNNYFDPNSPTFTPVDSHDPYTPSLKPADYNLKIPKPISNSSIVAAAE